MHETVVMSPGTLALLRRLMDEPLLAPFRLVGGTGLAIQLGHRTSVDLDLFESGGPRDPVEFRALVAQYAPFERHSESRVIRIYSLRGVKVDFVSVPEPWLDPPVDCGGIRLASPRDIAAMKLMAIVNRGTKKDFVDLHALLEIFTLEEMISFFRARYGTGSDFILFKSLNYFGDADKGVMPEMASPIEWKQIKTEIRIAVDEMLQAREDAVPYDGK